MEPRVIEKYKSAGGARSYDGLYERTWIKRASHRWEAAIIARAFARLDGPQDRMLDLPSGTGRLFPLIQPHARWWVESDVSLEMLKLARGKSGGPRFVQASAFHMPYRDGAFDGVFSARLTHHIPDPAERDRFIRELGRVSRRWVIMTYFHKWSIKNILRLLRRPFNRKRPKVVMSTSELRQVARTAGLELVASIPLSRLCSGHHYAVLRKKSQPPIPKSQ